jgi:hypothetical protein
MTPRATVPPTQRAIGGIGMYSRDFCWPPAETRSGGRNINTRKSMMTGSAGRSPLREMAVKPSHPKIDSIDWFVGR